MDQRQTIGTLHDKRKEIEAYIGSLRQDLEQAERDLSAILAAIKAISAEGVRVTAYMNLSRLFPRHELPKLALQAFNEAQAPLSTRDVAAFVIEAKQPDKGDRHLRKAITYKLVQVLRRWERQAKLVRTGKDSGAVVWKSSCLALQTGGASLDTRNP
ncbi:MAG: hypothetical protein ACKVP5_18045 [Aestuariivirga sp.]